MGRAPLISAVYQEDFAASVPMNRIRCTNSRAERRIGMSGQSVVEIAFSLPFLLVIVLIVIEMGIVFSTYLAVVNAAREGAVFASMYPKLVDATCGSTPQPDCVGASDSLPMNGVRDGNGPATTPGDRAPRRRRPHHWPVARSRLPRSS